MFIVRMEEKRKTDWGVIHSSQGSVFAFRRVHVLHVQLLSHVQLFVILLDCNLSGFSVHGIFIRNIPLYYCFRNRAES